MRIDNLRLLVQDDFEAMNTLLLSYSQSDVSLINDITHSLLLSGGKRLRPLLVLLACKACQYQGPHNIQLAAIIEFFHTATLLHDDVIDESMLRRGQKTAHAIWGNKASILVGDYLYTRFMQLMLDVGDLRIMQRITDMAYQVGCGEINQLTKRNHYSLSVEEYYELIESKTSLLFALSAELGGLISHSDPDIIQALHNYGLHLGNAFQLTDDALDYCSNTATIGKNIGDDLTDGKVTMPLLHILQNGNDAQKAFVQESLSKHSLENLEELLQLIKEMQSIEYTQALAQEEAHKAQMALNILPNSEYKNALFTLAEYAFQRNN